MIVLNRVNYFFELMLASWQLQFAFAFGQGALLYAYPKPQFIPSSDTANDAFDLETQVYEIRLMLFAAHLMGFGFMAFGQGENVRMPFFRESCRLLIPVMTMYVWINLSLFVAYTGAWSLFSQHRNTYSIFLVLYAENYAFFGYIFVAGFYLAIRNCFKHKLRPEYWFMKRNLQSDEETLVAHRYILNLIYNVFIPAISQYGIVRTDLTAAMASRNRAYYQTPLMDTQFRIGIYSNLPNLFFVIILIFVDYKKGSRCWTRTMPYVYLLSIWYMFLLCPLINIVTQLVTSGIHPSFNYGFWLEPWCIIFSALQLTMIVEYFRFFHRKMVVRILSYIKVRSARLATGENIDDDEEMERLSERQWRETRGHPIDEKDFKDRREEDADGNKIKLPYQEQRRRYGEGLIRLGTSLELDEDVYSLAFIVMMTDKYISMWFDIETGKLLDDDEREKLMGLTGAGNILTAIFNEYKSNTDFVIVQREDENQMISYAGKKLTVKDLIAKINEIERKRTQIFSKMLLTITVQGVILGQIAVQIFSPTGTDLDNLKILDLNVYVLFSRMFMGLILHLSMLGQLRSGLARMKYSINHSYMFQNPSIAAFIGFIQAFMNFMVEILNLFVILTSFDPIDILANFVVLQIISQFDNFMYDSLGNEPLKRLLYEDVSDQLLVVQHTTSKRCPDHELSDLVDDDGHPRLRRVNWSDRECQNKGCYFCYKITRFFFVVVYFYFVPIFVIYFSILIPSLTAPLSPSTCQSITGIYPNGTACGFAT